MLIIFTIDNKGKNIFIHIINILVNIIMIIILITRISSTNNIGFVILELIYDTTLQIYLIIKTILYLKLRLYAHSSIIIGLLMSIQTIFIILGTFVAGLSYFGDFDFLKPHQYIWILGLFLFVISNILLMKSIGIHLKQEHLKYNNGSNNINPYNK